MVQNIVVGIIVAVALFFLARRVNLYRKKFVKKPLDCGGCSSSCEGCPIAPGKEARQ